MIDREGAEVVLTLVLQFGISWESVFDILADQSWNIWKALVQWQLERLMENFVGKTGLFRLLLRTPSPQMQGNGIIFGTPSQPIWSNLKSLYWDRFLPVGYLALFLSVMISNFGKAWGLGVQRTKERQLGLLVGLFLLPGAWYLAVAYLKLMNLFALGILPNIADLQHDTTVALADILGGDVMYAFVVGSTAVAAFLLALLVNLMRLVTIWVIIPTLPLILGFDLGEFPILGRFGRQAYTVFVVMAAVPIPIGIGIRIIYSFNKMVARTSSTFFYDDIASTVFVIVIPSLMAFIPIYVFSKGADYATIRGATAALSFIGKPAALAASGGKTAAMSGLKMARSGSNRTNRRLSEFGGGNDGSGGDPPGGSPGSGGGGDSSGGAGLPTRTPSGARPTTRDGPGPNSSSSATVASKSGRWSTASGQLPPAQSDGQVVDADADFAMHADRELARSQVRAKGTASSYRRADFTATADGDVDPVRVSTNDADEQGGCVMVATDRSRRHQRTRTPTEQRQFKNRKRRQQQLRDRYYGTGGD